MRIKRQGEEREGRLATFSGFGGAIAFSASPISYSPTGSDWVPFRTFNVDWEHFQETQVDISSTSLTVGGSYGSLELSFNELGREFGDAPNGPLGDEVGGWGFTFNASVEIRSFYHCNFRWVR